jgi:hypothetical protein
MRAHSDLAMLVLKVQSLLGDERRGQLHYHIQFRSALLAEVSPLPLFPCCQIIIQNLSKDKRMRLNANIEHLSNKPLFHFALYFLKLNL